MALRNTAKKFGLISWSIHWIVVLGIIVQWVLAEAGDDALPLHQSLGLTILALALIRVVWRSLNPTPAWPADIKPYEIRIARAVHVALYLLLFAIPLSGWALASMGGDAEFLEELHEALFTILVTLAALHVVGAVKHWIAVRT